MVVCLSAILALFFLSDALYVSRIAVGGQRYMTQQEVFNYANITDLHIFWVEPDAVRENLMDFPTVADAQVRLGWPPNMVNIIVEEREPALIWEQGEQSVWADINGIIMPMREQRTDLVQVRAADSVATDFVEDGSLDAAIVYGALQLRDLRPEVTTWRYDPVNGLGYENEIGWDVWFGDGTGMPEKWEIYANIRADVAARGLAIQQINIANPDAPYYRFE